MNRTPRCKHKMAPGYCVAPGCPHTDARQRPESGPPRITARKCDRCGLRRTDLELDGQHRHCATCREELRLHREQRGMGGFGQRENRSARQA